MHMASFKLGFKYAPRGARVRNASGSGTGSARGDWRARAPDLVALLQSVRAGEELLLPSAPAFL